MHQYAGVGRASPAAFHPHAVTSPCHACTPPHQSPTVLSAEAPQPPQHPTTACPLPSQAPVMPARHLIKTHNSLRAGTSAATAPTQPYAPVAIKGRNIEEIVNEWSAELEQHAQAFVKHACECERREAEQANTRLCALM
eukprot:181684-Pelagomonas_calceolata.AAC.2